MSAKIFMFLSMAFLIQEIQLNAQTTLLSEGFETSTFPPTSWTTLQTTAGNAWSRVTSGANPAQTPHTGGGEAKFNSGSPGSGVLSLVTPVLNFTVAGAKQVSFWVYRDNGYNWISDKIEVLVGTSNNAAGLASATLLGSINRPRIMAPIVTADGWYQYTYAIPAGYNTAANYIFFRGTGSYGNNIFIDDISVTNMPLCTGIPTGGTAVASVASGCAGFSSVLSVTGATVDPSLTFQWQSATTATGPWSDVVGATNATFNATATTSIYYRRNTICLNSGSTAPSSAIQLMALPCLNMSNTTVTACSGVFYDSGGNSGNYSNSENYTMTICATAGMYPRVQFTSFETEFATTPTTDWLKIYNGNSTTAPLIGSWFNTNSPGTITGTNTCLTYQFHSDGSVNRIGWEANISCVSLCTGSPAGGTGVATFYSLCTGDSTLLTVTGSPSDQGLTYQWESSPTGAAPWTVIAGATGATYYAKITSDKYFRRKITCSSGGLFEYCTPIHLIFSNCIPTPCSTNPSASDNFGTATSICNLDGYCGNTSGTYTIDSPGNIDWSIFPGTIDNNSWLSFVAGSTQSVFSINVSNCSFSPVLGIQMRVYGVVGTTFTPYSNFLENVTNHSIMIASGLTVGQTYYLMIDGQAGDHCDYSITALSGVATSIIDAGNDTTICPGQSVQLNAVGGTSYQWSPTTGLSDPNIANPIATPAVTTTYTVSVTGGPIACSTTGTDTVKVTIGSITPVATNNGPLCIGSTLNLNVTPNGGTYQWSGPNGFNQNTQNPTIPAVALADSGTYYVTVSLASGCTGTAQTNVVVNTSAGASITNLTGSTELTCTVTPINVIAIGGTTYLWSGGATPSTAANSFTTPGIYTVTVSTGGGCTSTASITITQNATAVNAGITNNHGGNTQLNCTLTSIDVQATPSGATSYLWSGGSSMNTDTNSFSVPGIYTVTVTSANGCTDTESITITQDNTPPAVTIANNIGGTLELNCSLSSINVTANPAGATSYLWSGGSSVGTSTNSFTTPGTYTVTVTGLNGCTGTASTTITQNTTIPNAGITNNSNGALQLTCVLTSINVTASPAGATSYLWSGGSSVNTASNSFSSPGTYTVTVTTANGCTESESIVITQDASVITASITNNSNGALELSCTLTAIDVTATPAGAASYLWSGGLSTNTASNSFTVSGTYFVTVTAANGCTDTESITISQEVPLQLNIGNILPDHCSQGIGEATVIATGGSGVYDYEWNTIPTQLNAHATQLSVGSYQAIVHDGPCSDTVSVIIGNVSGPTAAFQPVPGIASGDNPEITFQNGSINEDLYFWSFGDGSSGFDENPSHLYDQSGEYTVILHVTDDYGCSDTVSHIVKIIDEMVVFIPNAFTPDGDGVNDVFKPSGTGFNLDKYEMIIFDRWGKTIFISNNFDLGWDGKVEGEKLNINAIFIYQIKFTDLNGFEKLFLGQLTILGSRCIGD